MTTEYAWWFNFLLVVFTGCLVFVGIVQIIVYAFQAYYMRQSLSATRRQGDIAERSISALERAWVAVGLEPNYAPNPEARVIPFVIQNCGRTPAQIKEISGSLVIADALIEYEIPPIPEGPLPTILTIFASESQQHMIATERIHPDHMHQVNHRTKLMIIHGSIIYDDIFTRRHVTRFYQVYSPLTRNFIFPKDADPKYNQTT